MNSNANDLTRIYDSEDNVCGEGATADFPFLFMQNFDAPYKSVCVKECPQFDYNAIKYNIPYNGDTSKNPDYDKPLDYENFSKNFAGLSHTKDLNFNEKEAFAFNADWVNGYFTEEQFNTYKNSIPI